MSEWKVLNEYQRGKVVGFSRYGIQCEDPKE
jgi:hypothetical protein